MAEIVWKISVPSTAFLKGVIFSTLSGRKCVLEYSYESEENFSVIFEKLIFVGVESFKCTYYRACSIEMIEAFDRIIDVENSNWLTETKYNLSAFEVDQLDLKHLRIYFDDGPCYEFICRSFEVKSDEQENYFVNPNNAV